jgi:hypothetical protein
MKRFPTLTHVHTRARAPPPPPPPSSSPQQQQQLMMTTATTTSWSASECPRHT